MWHPFHHEGDEALADAMREIQRRKMVVQVIDDEVSFGGLFKEV